jgi:hypothetical protein
MDEHKKLTEGHNRHHRKFETRAVAKQFFAFATDYQALFAFSQDAPSTEKTRKTAPSFKKGEAQEPPSQPQLQPRLWAAYTIAGVGKRI